MAGEPADPERTGSVELYWIPLGTGNAVVQLCGRAFEAVAAAVGRRPRCALYHSALEVVVPAGRFSIEMAPVPDGDGATRGVVAEGPVGLRSLGRLRVFRYEVRCCRGGVIPDRDAAVASPVRLTDDPEVAQRVLEVLPSVPTAVWGRHQLVPGDMWNSNSVVAWALVRAGIEISALAPPPGGRAPGWEAGLAVAARESRAAG